MFFCQETDQPKSETTCGVAAGFSSCPGQHPTWTKVSLEWVMEGPPYAALQAFGDPWTAPWLCCCDPAALDQWAGCCENKVKKPQEQGFHSSFKTRKRFAVLLKIFQINLILCLFLFHSGSRWRLWFATFTCAFLGSWLWILEFCYLCIQSFSNRFLRIPFNPSFPRNLGGSIGVIDSSGDICWGDRKGPMRHNSTGVWWSSAG